MRNALRMRPDRVLLGEVRSHEVLDMLQAMNTGHDGCMSTVHANSPRDALLRLEMLAGFAGFQGQEVTLKHMIATALDLVIQVGRLSDGRRRVLADQLAASLAQGRAAAVIQHTGKQQLTGGRETDAGRTHVPLACAASLCLALATTSAWRRSYSVRSMRASLMTLGSASGRLRSSPWAVSWTSP